MDLRVLGPVEVVDDGATVPIGGPRQRLVLALLILNVGETVSTDRLVDDVWGDEPPDAARRTVQAYVSNLRKALDPHRLGTLAPRSPGYALEVEDRLIDARRFEALVAEAGGVIGSDPSRAAEILRSALSMWRGAPYADLAGSMPLRAEITRLEELRRSAIELRIDADLSLGHHGHVVGELETLVGEHPLSERFACQLMLALYRSGRQADALRVARRAASTLGEELGIEPSRELRNLEQAILEHDPSIDAPVEASRGTPGRSGPDVIRGFEIRRRLGGSHFADNYLAYQRSLEREVAVSVLRPEYSNDTEFIRCLEAQLAKTIRVMHPNIAPFYDFWHERGSAYFVRRYFPRGSLEDDLETGSWNPNATARLILQLGSALETCHRRGLFHCDLKASNIMLDEDGNGYITHFAIPRAVFADREHYLAHATASGGATPGDVELPDEIPEIDVNGLATLARRLTTLEPNGESASLSAVLDRATATSPTDRYSSVAEFLEAFVAVHGDDETSASSVTHNPYKGLRSFVEADQGDFFGREELVSSLVPRLSPPEPNCLLLVGASGIGKSSILNAGLVPALREGAAPGSEAWRIVKMHPGVHPYGELAGALRQVSTDPDPQVLGHLTWGDIGIGEALASTIGDPDSEVLLLIDQFEELFTLVRDESVRTSFIESLVDAVDDPDVHLRLVLALRADFYDRPLRYPRLATLLTGCMVTVMPMTEAELHEAITEPARRAGAELDPGLAGRIVEDVQRQPGMLPLIQYAMTDLFERRDGNRITAEAYEASGGVRGPLATRPEVAYLQLDAETRAAARQVFLHLVAVDEDGEAARRRVHRSELTSIVGYEHAARTVINSFGQARLLSFDRHPVTRSPTVEIAHDALLVKWERLRGWIDDHRSDVRLHQRLASATGDWDSSDRDPEFLLTGGVLDRLEGWSKATDLALSDTERSLINASVDARDFEEREEAVRVEHEHELEDQSRRRLRMLAVVWTLTALVAVLAVFAFAQWQRSENLVKQSVASAAADDLAGLSDYVRTRDPELATLIALRAVEITLNVEAPVTVMSYNALTQAVRKLDIPSPEGGRENAIGITVAEIIVIARSNLTRGFTHDECAALGFGTCPTDTIASPLDS